MFASVRALDCSVDIFREAFLLLKGGEIQGLCELSGSNMPELVITEAEE